MQLLKRVLTAVVLIPIVLLLILSAPITVLALVAGLVALLAVSELLKLAESYSVKPFYLPTYAFVAAFFIFLAINPADQTRSHCFRRLYLSTAVDLRLLFRHFYFL